MKTISFNEIIEASSQKSAITGQAGFGVRTYTSGISEEDVRKISGEINCAYDIPVSRQVTFQQLSDDPSVVTHYPRTLKYAKVQDANGNDVYAIACTTYVGIDYGFFCGMDSARRVGSNYIADVILLRQKPSAQMFYQLVSKHTFLPVDNTCLPDNNELQALLTGEPRLLVKRSVDLPEKGEETPDINSLTGKVALAFLQTKINRELGKEESKTDIVIQADESMTTAILQAMATLPDELVDDMYFQTNYLQGYGVPTGSRMVFLNEFNEDEVYTDNYVFLDLKNGQSKNIDSNFYYEKILKAASDNEFSLYYRLVSYLLHMKLDADSDYKFLYELFATTEGGVKLTIDDLTTTFFDKVKRAKLQADKLEPLRNKVSEIIKPALCNGNRHAFDITNYLLEHLPKVLHLSDDTRQRLTTYIFTKEHLDKFVKQYGVDFIDYVNTRNIEDADFFDAMKGVGDSKAWQHLVNHQFDNDIANKSDETITAILSSQVGNKEKLILALYPLPDNIRTICIFIAQHTETAGQLRGIVAKMCELKGTTILTALLNATSYSKDVVEVVQSVAHDYFSKITEKDAEKGAEAISLFLYSLADGKSLSFDFSDLLDKYYLLCEKNPKEANSDLVDKLYNDTKVNLSKDAFEVFGDIVILHKTDVSASAFKGNFRELMLTRWLSDDEKLVVAVFKKWVNKETSSMKVEERDDKETSTMTVENLSKFLETGNPLSFNAMADVINTLWKQHFDSQEKHDSLVRTALDKAKWKSQDRKTFIAACKDKDLVEFINKNSGIVNKVKNFIFRRK